MISLFSTRIPRPCNGTGVFNKQGWTTRYSPTKEQSWALYSQHTQNYLKMDLRPKTVTLSEGNKCIYLHSPGLGNTDLNMTTEAQATKEKPDKLDFIKINKEVKKPTE